ncbi:MAG TPA: hypothetical protein V6C65_19445 [Allocoleopsis sp.]
MRLFWQIPVSFACAFTEPWFDDSCVPAISPEGCFYICDRIRSASWNCSKPPAVQALEQNSGNLTELMPAIHGRP